MKCHATNDDRDLSLTEGPTNVRIVDENDASSKGSLLKDICAVSFSVMVASNKTIESVANPCFMNL